MSGGLNYFKWSKLHNAAKLKLCAVAVKPTLERFSQAKSFLSKARPSQPKAPHQRLMQQGIKPTVKYSGGDVGMLCLFRNWWLTQMNYILTAEKNHSILQKHAIPSGIKSCGKGFIFQPDNGPKHVVTGLFEVQWRAKSADMHGFPFTVTRRQPYRTSLRIYEKAKGESYCNITGFSLICAEKDCLNNVDSHIFQKYVEPMPVRVQAEIKDKVDSLNI